MSPSNQNTTENITRLSVDFILRAEKQHLLIHFLKNYTQLNPLHLATALSISVEKLIAVSKNEAYLHQAEAEKLIKQFCIVCGN